MASLEKVGLSEKWKNMPNQLSADNKRYPLLALAKPLTDTGGTNHRSPGIQDQPRCAGFLKQLNDEGNTIVMITHDNAIAMEARRVVRIKDGQINFDGEKDCAAII